MEIKVSQKEVTISSHAKSDFSLYVYNEKLTVKPGQNIIVALKSDYYV